MRKFLIVRQEIFKMDEKQTVTTIENSLANLLLMDIDPATMVVVSKWIRSLKFKKIKSPLGIFTSIFTKITSQGLLMDYQLFPVSSQVEYALVTCTLQDDNKLKNCRVILKILSTSKRMAREIFSWHMLETCYYQFLKEIMVNCNQSILERSMVQLEKLKAENKKISKSKGKKGRKWYKKKFVKAKKNVKLRKSSTSRKRKRKTKDLKTTKEEPEFLSENKKRNQMLNEFGRGNLSDIEKSKVASEMQIFNKIPKRKLAKTFDDEELRNKLFKSETIMGGSKDHWRSTGRETGEQGVSCDKESLKQSVQVIGNVQIESISNQNVIPISIEKPDFPQNQCRVVCL